MTNTDILHQINSRCLSDNFVLSLVNKDVTLSDVYFCGVFPTNPDETEFVFENVYDDTPIKFSTKNIKSIEIDETKDTYTIVFPSFKIKIKRCE